MLYVIYELIISAKIAEARAQLILELSSSNALVFIHIDSRYLYLVTPTWFSMLLYNVPLC